MSFIAERLLFVIPFWLSLSVHEFAHAATALWLGDDTAKRLGRVTLDPLAHLDPIGTVLFPLLGIPFGWAKPVPIQPSRFRRDVPMGTGVMLTAVAGPLSNLMLAVMIYVGYLATRDTAPPLAQLLIVQAFFLNVNLALFNLMPFPPLDGSRVVDAFLPYRYRHSWEAMSGPLGIILAMGGFWLISGWIRPLLLGLL